MRSIVAVADYVDRICSIEMRSSRIKPGSILRLYEHAREVQGLPLTYLAAQRLIQTIRPGDNVFIITGIGEPHSLPKGETDGPPGAAAFTRVLTRFFQANPVVISEREYLGPILASYHELVSNSFSRDNEKQIVRGEVMPLQSDHAQRKTRQLLQEYNPVALISVEALGPNAKGVCHSLGGYDWTAYNAPFHHLFDQASKNNILTIGVGDGGNEVGCGLIYESVRAVLEYGTRCQCPCKDGVATVTATDVLMLAGTSNWGVYGIEANLAMLLGDSEILHSPTDEERSLSACIAAGARDGPTGSSDLLVDAIPIATHKALLVMLRTIVGKYLE
jgi:hypothetical protein